MRQPAAGSVSLVYETHATTLDNESGHSHGVAAGRAVGAGRDERARLGDRRRDDGIELVVSSDLRRAVQTVEIAFAGSPVPRRLDRRLREVDFGELTGAPVDVVHAQRRRRVDDPFPGGQSYRQVTDGVLELLGELPADHPGQRLLLVGHAATRFALDHLLTGRPLERAVTAPFAWREGWEYVVGATLPTVAVLDGPGAARGGRRDRRGLPSGVHRTRLRRDRRPGAVVRHRDAAEARRLRRVPACHRPRGEEPSLGFGYGYTGQPGQWWSEQVAAAAPPAVCAEWLGGHFEVPELAVRPDAQGRGFGAAVMDTLLLGLPHGRALLTTYADDRAAPRLYQRLGWTRLAAGVLPGSDLWGIRLSP